MTRDAMEERGLGALSVGLNRPCTESPSRGRLGQPAARGYQITPRCRFVFISFPTRSWEMMYVTRRWAFYLIGVAWLYRYINIVVSSVYSNFGAFGFLLTQINSGGTAVATGYGLRFFASPRTGNVGWWCHDDGPLAAVLAKATGREMYFRGDRDR